MSTTDDCTQSLEKLLAIAFTKVAQHACRQGEKGSRAWPHLSDLPAPESWGMVGRQYAREFALELVEHLFLIDYRAKREEMWR